MTIALSLVHGELPNESGLPNTKQEKESYWGLSDYVGTRIAVSITEHHHGHPAECAQSGLS